MKILHMVLGLAMMLGAAAATGQFTLNLDVDTYVDSASPTESFSDEKVLWATSADGMPSREVYLGFNNSFGSTLTFSPNDIESAVLRVHVAEVEKPGNVKAYFSHSTTLETIAWVDRPERDNSTEVSISVSKPGDYTIDATKIVRKAIEACAEGCPFSIVLDADGDASVGFSSSKDLNDKAAKLIYYKED